MTPSVAELAVREGEWLARYIVRKQHVRRDGTVKPDPFIPFKYVELSVTRHLALSEQEIWDVGCGVASQTHTQLQGRADAQALIYIRQRLQVITAPEVKNPNHANVTCWPADKQTQKEIALEIVKYVSYKAKPIATL
jgi:NADH dehydrogenase FAD-containing subunit